VNLRIIHNPAAGRSGQGLFRSVLAGLATTDCRITVHHTEGLGHAGRLAADAAVAVPAVDRLVVAGGDGTINEVVNGWAEVEAPPPIAIVPIGTANVLATEIGLRIRKIDVLDTILRGEPTPISVGVVGDRRFVLMAGAGFDAHVVAGVDKALKRRVGKLAYAVSFIQRLWSFKFPTYRVSIDGVGGDAASVVVTNARRYAGPYVIAPDADLRDGQLQVCRFLTPGRWAAVSGGVALFSNRLKVGPGFAIGVGRRIVIDGPLGDPVQVDGDIVATLPIEITSLPGALKLVYPPTTL